MTPAPARQLGHAAEAAVVALARAGDDVAFEELVHRRQGWLRQLQRRRRWRLLGRASGAAVIATALGVGLGMSHALPWLEGTIPLLPLTIARETAPLGDWLVTPVGWAASLLLGAAVLWRSKALRR